MRGELIANFSLWSSAPLSIYSGRPVGVRPDRWDVPPRLVFVPSGNLVRLVDLHARTVTTVFEAPEPIVSVGVPTLSASAEGETATPRPLLVRAGRKVYRLDNAYKVISTINIPPEIDSSSPLTWYETGKGQAIVECPAVKKPGDDLDGTVTRSTLYRIANDGTIQESTRSHVEERIERADRAGGTGPDGSRASVAHAPTRRRDSGSCSPPNGLKVIGKCSETC